MVPYRMAAFSPNGHLLACREESHPRCVWIWDVPQCKLLTVLVFLDNVAMAAWRRTNKGGDKEGEMEMQQQQQQVLAVCCGTARVYFWNAVDGASFAALPDAIVGSMRVQALRWGSGNNDRGGGGNDNDNDGNGSHLLLLQDKEVICTLALS